MRMRTILFPTDFSRCAGQALPQALFLARSYHARLHMLHAAVLLGDDPHAAGAQFPDVEAIAQRLKEAVAAGTAKPLPPDAHAVEVVQVQRRGVSAANVIIDYAGEIGADLIVMGTHGRRGLGHLLLGSVAEEVVRDARCAVLTVRERRDDVEPEALERILVPIDFSAHSREALATARELASRYAASLQLLHVVEEAIVPDFYLGGRVVDPVSGGELASRAREALAKLYAETGGPDVPHEAFAVEGRAWHGIIDFATETNSDLIVIASHGLTGIEHALLGSVAEKVVRTAPCPVLTLKTAGKASA